MSRLATAELTTGAPGRNRVCVRPARSSRSATPAPRAARYAATPVRLICNATPDPPTSIQVLPAAQPARWNSELSSDAIA